MAEEIATVATDRLKRIWRLEDAIRRRMNHGLQIARLGVRGPTPQFAYALTEEKIARLRKEGLEKFLFANVGSIT